MPAVGAFLPASACPTNDAVCHNPWHSVRARKFGLTHFDPTEVQGDLVPYLVKLMRRSAASPFINR
jgi:hypothetical protein